MNAAGTERGAGASARPGPGGTSTSRAQSPEGTATDAMATAGLEHVQEALGIVARRAKDLSLHEVLGQRVGYPLEGPYYATLARLGLAGPCTVSELAGGLGLELSTVSRRVKALEERGLVERRTDDNDRRISHLRLSTSGRAMFDALSKGWRDMLAEALADWSPEDLDAFTRLFVRFAADLDRYAERHG